MEDDLYNSSSLGKFYPMHSLSFEKEKYIKIMQNEGITQALTALHHDTDRWEYQSFEGPEGYQPQLIQALDDVREFSRELWQMALEKSS
jgi:hypothetical protein